MFNSLNDTDLLKKREQLYKEHLEYLDKLKEELNKDKRK